MEFSSEGDWAVNSESSWPLSKSVAPALQFETELTDPTNLARNLEWGIDDDYLAVVSYDTNTYIYDDNFELIDTLTDATDRARSLDWSLNGEDLVTGSEDETIYIYPVAELGNSPTPNTLEDADARVNALRYHPTRDLLAATVNSPDGRVLIYDTTDYTLLTSLDSQNYAYAAQWSPSGDYLAISGDEGGDTVDQVIVYDTSATDPDNWTVTFRDSEAHGADESISTVDWSPSGSRLVSGGQDGTTHFYDPTANFELVRILANADGAVRVWRLRYSPDGDRLAVATPSTTIYKTANYTIEFLQRFEDAQLALAWSNGGDILATGGYDERVSVYRYSTT